MRKTDKEKIVQLMSRWRERSHLSVKQIVARIQAQGCDLSRSMFENRFIRFDQQPDISPQLTLAVIAAFTQGLTPAERCTPAEAIELAKLTHLPIDQFAEMRPLFLEDEFDRAFSRYAPAALPEHRRKAGAKPGPTTPLPLHLPGKAYHRLMGREQELKQLLAALREPERKPIIAVVGLGGIGKTALAQEAMGQCWREGIFDHIVWASAKPERFVGEGARKTEVSDYGFESLLDDIGRQCGRMDLAKLPLAQKQAALKQFLRNKRVLVVMDNLETIPESDVFVDKVFQILGRSKLLITSRHQVRLERTFTLDLGGFLEKEGVAFLREEGAERGIGVVAQAKPGDLLTIHQVTGGAPLAMKLVVGQASRLPLSQVLHNLQAANFAGPNYEFYRFIFKHSWNMLAVESQKVLVSMSVFDLANGSTTHALQQVSQLEFETVQAALDQLILLSFVDVLGNLAQRRYTLHPLTHYFILSDIVKKWS
ncbi:MAG: AAA family ATPase [Anaerolineae bacterium]|nr:AAA family ATPase [Anaerolineae bacterium]